MSSQRQIVRDDDGNPILRARMTRRGLLIRAGAIGLGTISLPEFLAATASPASGAMKKLASGTVVFATDGSAGTAEPATFTTFGDEFVIDMVTRGLTLIDFASNAPKLLLADSVQVSNGGKSYTFVLKQNLTHHDGSAFTANDVVRTFERQLKDKDPTVPQGVFYSLRAAVNNNVAAVTAKDDHTVVFDLNTPDPIFLSRIQDPSCHIISSAALDKYGSKIGQNLVGCGPFSLVSLAPQQGAVLQSFAGYVGGQPAIDRLVLQPVPSSSTLTGSLLSGQIQATSFAPHASAKSLKASGKVQIYNTSRLVKLFVMMNAASPALKEIEIRQAVNYAIDRNAIIQKALFGYADYPDGYAVCRTEIGHDPSLKYLSVQNLDKAKALVQKIGATGRTVGLIGQNNDWYPTALQIISDNLKAIGLNPQVTAIDPATFAGKAFDPKGHDLALWERNNWIPDPATGVGSLFAPGQAYAAVGTGQLTFPKALNDQVAALLAKGELERDPVKRKSIYTQVQKLVTSKMMIIAMVAYSQAIVASNGVTGIGPTALSTQRMVMEKTKVV